MNENTPLQIMTTTVRTIDANTVYLALSDESRRQVLASLFDGQWHAVRGMGGSLPKHKDLLRKHCDVLVKSGLIETQNDPTDARRRVYRLAPFVVAETTPRGRTLDFGYCVMRL